MEYWVVIIVAIISGLLGGGLLTASQARVDSADAWAKLVTQLQAEVIRLSDRVTGLETNLADKDKIIAALDQKILIIENFSRSSKSQ